MYSGYDLEHIEKNVDLQVRLYGYEDCEPGHYYGPAVRGVYLFHYIFSGCGVFQANEQTHHLSGGQGFLIHPEDITFYKADTVMPWSYGWFGISGLQAKNYFRESGLTRENPIWRGGKDASLESVLLDLSRVNIMEPSSYPLITGYAYILLARLIKKATQPGSSVKKTSRQEAYIHAAIHYINQNYHKKLTIDEISRYVGLDRSYLGTLFMKNLHISMQDFLTNLRMDKACSLLEYGNIMVGDVARSVGYPDQLHFSRIFKNRKGVSPSEYQKQCGSTKDNHRTASHCKLQHIIHNR